MKSIIIFCIFLTLILTIRFLHYYSTKIDYKVGQKVVIEQTLLDESKIYGNFQVFYVDGLRVTTVRFPEFGYGNDVKVSGIVGKQTSSQNKYVINKKEILIVKNPKIELVKSNSNFLLSLTSFIRQKVTYTFNQYLNKNEASLLLGIVFGIKQSMDLDYYDAMRNAGVMHVIAASGMNVTLTGGFILGIFNLFFNRYVAIFLTFLGIIFYAVLSGLDPSIVRATIMAGFGYGASVFGRQNYTYVSLLAAVFIMLFISPDLISDAGFQLSFLSTFGILSVRPIMSGLTIFKNKGNMMLSDDFLTTFSAQIGSLPILLYDFGSYQVLSIPVNMLVLWTVPILMLLGGIASVFALTLPIMSPVFLYMSLPFLLFFKFVVMSFSFFVKPSEIGNIPIVMVVGYYFVLVSAILYLSKNTKRSKPKD